eukprot:CAMPEP_0180292026 /NCGR_PEP_ID=MMETSP0988-20121125/16515_1 /TAXON_ID=697907 /ORGANISM="non described non described, Strain CCMP2293" /LENGTH=170 /DNA_ID=CAMNT_0022268049 /DNA_START=16 /DNA_END=529 /DNA_ORIENTATION=+
MVVLGGWEVSYERGTPAPLYSRARCEAGPSRTPSSQLRTHTRGHVFPVTRAQNSNGRRLRLRPGAAGPGGLRRAWGTLLLPLKQKLSQEHQPPAHLGGADGGIGFMLMQLQRFLEWQLHGQERHCEYRENHRGLLQRRQTDYIAPAIASRTALLIFPAAPMRLQLKAAGS